MRRLPHRHRLSRANTLWLALVPMLSALLLSVGNVLERWDAIVYDTMLKAWERPAADDIVIVAIDPESLERLGRWPWPRTIHAQLLDTLRQAGSRAVGMDILFAEPDAADAAADAQLVTAAQAIGRVVLPVAPDNRSDGRVAATLPVAPLARVVSLGHVDVELETDGVVRSAYLEAGPGTQRWPAFAVSLLRSASAGIRIPHAAEARPSNLATNAERWSRDRRVLVPFFGGTQTFRHIPYSRLIDRDPDSLAAVRNRFVLVGATAGGLGQAFATPVSPQGRPMPGIEVHAHLLANLEAGTLVAPLPRAAHWSLSAALALLPLLVLPLCRGRWTLAATGTLVALLLAGTWLLFTRGGTWFGPSAALVGVIVAYPVWSWRRLAQTLDTLRQERGRMRATLQAVGEGVITTDRSGRIEYLNPVAEALTGWSRQDAQGLHVDVVVHAREEADDRAVAAPVHECVVLGRGVRPPATYVLADREGRERAIRWSANPVRDGLHIIGMVLALSDVSENRALEEEMRWQATHDPLTGLPNRALLLDRLDKAVARARRAGRSVAILFIDLDGFKKVNDAFGHAGGDALLAEVAERLRQQGRDEDTVARWGGDEFAVLLENQDSRDGVAATARKLLTALARPFETLGQEVYVTGSIGVSLYPQDGEDVGGLLKRADAAMYRAKDEGRNAVHFFSRDMSDHAVERLSLERDLWTALRHGELSLHYQPKVSVASGRITGAEALLRWEHPVRGMVPPDEFIPIAEQSDLIHALGDWVLRTAFAQLARWQSDGLEGLGIAVNLAPAQINRPALCDRIADVLDETGADATRVVLEINENLFLKDPVAVARTLASMRALGMRVAIDDFGTGHSSIGHLKRLPIDQVKIDLSFVRPIANGPDDAAIVRGMIALAHSLHLEVVAEGVETQRQYEILRELGCDEVQGYHLGRALPVADFEALVASHGRLPPAAPVDATAADEPRRLHG